MEVVITPEQESRLARMAKAQGRDIDALVQEAVERLLGHEEWFTWEVEKGMAAADRGELVEGDEVRRMIEARYRG